MAKLDVVHAIIKAGSQFLLGKRSFTKQSGPGYWAIIGGRVEIGESLESAVVRECLEELGIVTQPHRKVACIEEEEATHYWFEVNITSGEPFLACDENIELRWLTLPELETLSPVTEQDRYVLGTHFGNDS